jgi:hypothetical protein
MKTKEIIKGILFLVGVLILAAACNDKGDDPHLDFDITVPSTWNYYVLNADDIVYYATSPVESQTDSITEDILITKDDITGENLAQFSASVISSLDDDTTFHVISFSQDTTINGNTSRKLVHLQTLKAYRTETHDTIYLHAKKTSYFFVNNNYGYVVTMNALVTSFATYKPIFDNIIGTFKFRL